MYPIWACANLWIGVLGNIQPNIKRTRQKIASWKKPKCFCFCFNHCKILPYRPNSWHAVRFSVETTSKLIGKIEVNRFHKSELEDTYDMTQCLTKISPFHILGMSNPHVISDCFQNLCQQLVQISNESSASPIATARWKRRGNWGGKEVAETERGSKNRDEKEVAERRQQKANAPRTLDSSFIHVWI